MRHTPERRYRGTARKRAGSLNVFINDFPLPCQQKRDRSCHC